MQPFYLFYLVYCVYVGEGGGGERANTRTEDTAGKGGGTLTKIHIWQGGHT